MRTPPKTILVPTDFSGTSDTALTYAVDLAEKLDASLYVMHAFELPFVGFPDGNLTISAEMASRIIDAAEKELSKVARKFEGRKITITTVLEQADAREAILSVAKRIDADVIVMGTHGRRGIARALMGSTAECVVRSASIPVLTIRADTSKL